VEAGDIAGWNFGNRLAEQIRGFGPATAESERHIMRLDSGQFLNDGRGVFS
jgi:hypothetical protein